MADYYRDDFNLAALASTWTVTGDWEQGPGRVRLDVTDTSESRMDHSGTIGKGNCQIEATIFLDENSHLGLQILGRSGAGPGYEFAVETDEATPWGVTARIYRVNVARTRTLLASAALTAGAWSRMYRLKGRVQEAGVQRADVPVLLSLYFDDEDTPVLTYTDRAPGAGMGANYFGIIGTKTASGGDDAAFEVDSIIFRRILSVEAVDHYVHRVWTWDRLADEALDRLERGGNPQFDKDRMLEFLAFAEAELVKKSGEPWWLDRTYSLSASSMTVSLPAWIGRVYDAIIEAEEKHIPILTKAEFNFDSPGRTATGTPNRLVLLGLDDEGCLQYYVYPEPTATVTMELWVKARPGYVHDSGMTPITPPEHIEVLIFGALRRAFQYDNNELAWRQNERMWIEGVTAVRRENSKMTLRNARLRPMRDSHKWHSQTAARGAQWYRTGQIIE